MANTIKIRSSDTASAAPASLEQGELAINTADATLFWEDSSGAIQTTYLQPSLGDLADVSDTVPSPNTSVYVLANVPGTGWSSSSTIGQVSVGSEPVAGWPTGSVGGELADKAAKAAPVFSGNVGINTIVGSNVPLHVVGSGTVAIFGAPTSAFQFFAQNNGPSKIVTVGTPTSLQIGSGQLIPTDILYGNTAVATFNNKTVTLPAGSVSSSVYEPGIAFRVDPNTGIGTVNADTISVITGGAERMRVQDSGAIRFIPMSADPTIGRAGEVYYNSTTNKLRVHNGTSWVDLH